jgi:hypothetical protein
MPEINARDGAGAKRMITLFQRDSSIRISELNADRISDF